MTRPRSMIRSFLHGEASGGIVLMLASALALLLANLPGIDTAYFHALHIVTGPVLSDRHGPMTLHLWVNDAAMALFFLLVGLEIKRELVDGRLATWEQRRLPVIAAIAGMGVPAMLYLLVVRSTPGLAQGWAIPAATDIAFAIGVLALLGPRVPPQLKIFLAAVAIVDDMGAVAIIALAYTRALDWGALAAAAGVAAILWVIGGRGERRLWPFLVGFALLWLLTLRSGVHATVAGVVTALLIPITPSPGAPDDAASPLHRLEHALALPIAFAIVPLFAFANAGIALSGVTRQTLLHPLVVAIAAGLFVGKQAGIAGAIWLAERVGLAARPGGAPWRQVYGVALLAGIGFTMSFFIGQLAFPENPTLADEVKLGVLGGSLLSAIAGYCLLRFAPAKKRACAASSLSPS